MRFEKPDRFPLYEWCGYWEDTLGRWYREGLPPGMRFEDYFGFDKIDRFYLDPGPIPRFVPKILEEDERYRIAINEDGIVTKSLKSSTCMPCFLDFPVKSPEDYWRIKRRFNPRDPRRYPMTWSDDLIEYYRTTDNPVHFKFQGFFWKARDLMGLPYLLKAFYREPQILHDFFEFWADFLIEMSEEALSAIRPDYVDFAEDMSYKNGPHISPKLFEDFIQPSYRKITSFLRNNGVEVIAVDTDGDPTLLLPLLQDAGINCLLPLEVAAGIDVEKLRKAHGKLRFIGGVDKRALAAGGEKLEAEVRRRYAAAEQGGYIPCLDHNISPDISFENYGHYVELRKKLMHTV
jgi:uroporphyrinogen decarboxylase